jgi:periplasmic protein TonB
MTPVSARTVREVVTSISSIAVHCAVLSAVLVASFLHVEPLAGPPPAQEPAAEPPRPSAAVIPPKKVLDVKPVYPEAARAERAEGSVILEIVVGHTGAVEEVKVLKSSPLFDAAAAEAVKRWKYEPALLGGSKPVRVFMTVRVEFRLK